MASDGADHTRPVVARHGFGTGPRIPRAGSRTVLLAEFRNAVRFHGLRARGRVRRLADDDGVGRLRILVRRTRGRSSLFGAASDRAR